MSTYLGLTVLEVDPDSTGGRSDSVERAADVLDTGLGKRTVVDREDVPSLTRTLDWWLYSLQDASDFKAFMDERRGRVVPFWIPSFEHDLTLSGVVFTGSPTVNILDIDYSNAMFPLGGARRHLMIRNTVTGNVTYKKIITAVRNGDGTETLTLDAGAGQNGSNIMLSFLRYVRLDDDVASIEWLAKNVGRARLPFVEIPAEAPT